MVRLHVCWPENTVGGGTTVLFDDNNFWIVVVTHNVTHTANHNANSYLPRHASSKVQDNVRKPVDLKMYIHIPSSILISHPLPIHFQTHSMFLRWIFQNLHFIKKRDV